MNMAKVSANGKITVPMEIRNILQLREGDKVLFSQQDGKIVIDNVSTNAILKAQEAFEGIAEELGNPSDDDIQIWVDELRYGKAT